MVHSIEGSCQEDNNFIHAKRELEARGILVNIALQNDLYRIQIMVDGELYFEESNDLKIGTIKLNNQF